MMKSNVTIYKRTTPISTLTKEEVILNALHYCDNLINRNARESTNRSWNEKDFESEFTIKIITTIEYMYNNGVEGKTLQDVIFFCCTSISNYGKTLRRRFSIKLDYSVNTPRVVDYYKDDNESKIILLGETDDKIEEIEEEDKLKLFLTWLLSHGFASEYVILREFTNPRLELVLKYGTPSIKNICTFYKLTKEESSSVRESLKIRALQFGYKPFADNKKYNKSFLLSYGVIK